MDRKNRSEKTVVAEEKLRSPIECNSGSKIYILKFAAESLVC